MELFQVFSVRETTDFDERYAASKVCNEEGDRNARLLRRQYVSNLREKHHSLIRPQIILKYERGSTGHRIASSIFEKIDTIRFAYDFNELTQREKSDWLKSAFILEDFEAFEDLGENEAAALLNKDKTAFDQWKKKMSNTTTARNRMLELFLTVSFL